VKNLYINSTTILFAKIFYLEPSNVQFGLVFYNPVTYNSASAKIGFIEAKHKETYL